MSSDLNVPDAALCQAAVESTVSLGHTPGHSDTARLVADTIEPLSDPYATVDLADGERSSSRPAQVGAATSGQPRYQVVRPHAKGGLGEVSIARDTELNRTVALKEIQLAHAGNEDSRNRFLMEAQITARLEHPGVVPVYGLGSYADGRPYYAMRFIEGTSLSQAIADFHGRRKSRNPGGGEHLLELRQLLNRFLGVCNAIEYAHSRGVLHRDIKPANVMLGTFGETLVVDWGLAKVLGSPDSGTSTPGDRGSQGIELSTDSQQTRLGQVLGTPAYMSPEQAQGAIEQIGVASDIFCLGGTLYCLLTGQPPYAGANPLETLQRARIAQFSRPREILSGIPPALEAICLKAMARTIEDRYPSARSLANDLEKWLADEPVSARREPPLERMTRWVRRHRVSVVSTAAALLVAGTLAVTGILVKAASARAQQQTAIAAEMNGLRILADEQKGLAQQYLHFSRVNQASQAWRDGEISRMETLLELERPQGPQRDARGWEWHYLWRLRQRGQLTLHGHKSTVFAAAFSPDARILATSSSDRTIRLWDPTTGQEVGQLTGHTSTISNLAFGPDGHFLAGCDMDGTTIWEPGTGKKTQFLPGGSGTLIVPGAFSPDGTKFAGGAIKQIRIWDLSTGAELTMTPEHTTNAIGAAFTSDGKTLVTVAENAEVRTFDAQTAQPRLVLKDLRATCAAISPDDQVVACGSSSGSIVLYSLESGQLLRSLHGHLEAATSIAFTGDGKRLASASRDGTLKVWNVDSVSPLLTLRGHTAAVTDVEFSPAGDWLASASSDGTAKIWRPIHPQESIKYDFMPAVSRFDPHSAGSFLTESEGKLLLASAGIQRFSLSEQRQEHALVKTPATKSLAVSSNGELYAAATAVGKQMQIEIRQVVTNTIVKNLPIPAGQVPNLVFSPDNQALAAEIQSSMDAHLKIWNLTADSEGRIPIPARTEMHLAFSPDSRLLAVATGSTEGKRDFPSEVIVWDLSNQREVHREAVDDLRSSCVRFSPSGEHLAVAGYANAIHVWSVKGWNRLPAFTGHSKSVFCVAFSQDGTRMASGSSDRTIRIWDVAKAESVRILPGHAGGVRTVSFSPDGSRLASGAMDDKVKLWDVESGLESLSLEGHAAPVYSVAFTHDGRRLISFSEDKTIRIWDGSPE